MKVDRNKIHSFRYEEYGKTTDEIIEPIKGKLITLYEFRKLNKRPLTTAVIKGFNCFEIDV